MIKELISKYAPLFIIILFVSNVSKESQISDMDISNLNLDGYLITTSNTVNYVNKYVYYHGLVFKKKLCIKTDRSLISKR